MQHQRTATNGIHLHVVQDGPQDGPLLIFLHGFPEFWVSLRRQIPAFAHAGYRVWAPDQRGYNLSDKPDGIAAYCLDELAADVVGLIDAAGSQKAYLVGHDWGAAVAWWTAVTHPQRVERLVAMNVPHPAVMQQQLRHSPAQMRKSWYIFFFQTPRLPEISAQANNWRAATRALTSSSRAGTFSDADLDLYRQAWSQPHAYTSMLNWYRAIIQKPPRTPASQRVTPSTLLIWGAQDMFLEREMAQPSIDLCDDGRLVFIEEATHWVQHEEAEQVNQLLTEFLPPPPATTPSSA